MHPTSLLAAAALLSLSSASPAPNPQSSPSRSDSRPLFSALAGLWSGSSSSSTRHSSPSPNTNASGNTISACTHSHPGLNSCPAAPPKPASPATPSLTTASTTPSSSSATQPRTSQHPRPPPHNPIPTSSSMTMASPHIPPTSPHVPLIWAGKSAGAPKPICTKAMFLPALGFASAVAPGVMAGELGMMRSVPGPCTTYTTYETLTHTVRCGACVVEPRTIGQVPHVMCKSVATGGVGTRTVLGCWESGGVERFRRFD